MLGPEMDLQGDVGAPPTGEQEEEILTPEENGAAMANTPWPEKKPMVSEGVRDPA